MLPKPHGTPNICGNVALKPWLTPVLEAIILLGPGVILPTNAKSRKANQSRVFILPPGIKGMFW